MSFRALCVRQSTPLFDVLKEVQHDTGDAMEEELQVLLYRKCFYDHLAALSLFPLRLLPVQAVCGRCGRFTGARPVSKQPARPKRIELIGFCQNPTHEMHH